MKKVPPFPLENFSARYGLLYRGEKTGVHLASEACLDLSQKNQPPKRKSAAFAILKFLRECEVISPHSPEVKSLTILFNKRYHAGRPAVAEAVAVADVAELPVIAVQVAQTGRGRLVYPAAALKPLHIEILKE